MTTFNRRTRQKALYRWYDEICLRIHRSGFMDGFWAGLMVSVFSVVMAAYFGWGLV